MKRAAAVAILMAMLTDAAMAQTTPTLEPVRVLTSLPADAATITNYYKQDVYDGSDNKVGEIADVLLDEQGQVAGLIVSVGGFLGVGEKDVAMPFRDVHNIQKDGKRYLVINASKDALKTAPGYKYDRSATQWVPDIK